LGHSTCSQRRRYAGLSHGTRRGRSAHRYGTYERGAIFKIGRTNEPLRRQAELNQGFPPDISLAWRLITTLKCGDAQTAHEIERAMLDRCETEGYSLGREFLSLDHNRAQELIREIAQEYAPISQPTPTRSTR